MEESSTVWSESQVESKVHRAIWIHGLEQYILCMVCVWKLPNSFIIRVELRRTLRLRYMCWEESGCNLNQETFPIFYHTH